MITPIRNRSSTTSGPPLQTSLNLPKENRRSPQWRWTRFSSTTFRRKSPRRLPPRIFVRIFSVSFHSSFRPSTVAVVWLAGTWKGKLEEHPGMSKSTKRRWTVHFLRYPRVVHTTWEFLGDVREFRLHISLAFADRRCGVLPLPERRSRARARVPPLTPLLWGPQPSARPICVRLKAYWGRKRKEALAQGVQPCRSCRSRSVQDARYPGTLSRRVPLTRGRDLIKHEFLRLIKS